MNQRHCLILLCAVLLSGCTAAPAPTAAPSRSAAGCAATVREDTLPTWARAGFSDPAPSGIPYVLGARGNILGVVFGYPLTAPPSDTGRQNKILWVASPAAEGSGSAASPDLTIVARLDNSGEEVRREVPGGPGPSIVDLPRPGCWHLALRWAGRSDTLDLRYESR